MGGARRGFLASALGAAARAAGVAREEVLHLTPESALAHLASHVFPSQTFARTRTALFRAAGVRIGLHSLILGPMRLTGVGNPFGRLSIGNDTIITGPFHADLGAELRIGHGVRIGHDVTVLTINHQIGDRSLRSGTSYFAPVEIGNGAWIASRVTILPGVSIGAGAVVAAGAVVTRDVAPDTMVAGVPARFLRKLALDSGRSAEPAS